MREPTYATSKYPVREDIREAHRRVVLGFARAGTWWTGAERRAIAAEARAARDCSLCRERKAALSPGAVAGEHDGRGELPPEVVDVIHRIITDPGRLSRSWYEKTLQGDSLDDGRYVELVSVSVVLNALDVFARALGVAPAPLPAEVTGGAPSHDRPSTARIEGAWVPQIPAGDAGGEEWRGLYGDVDFVPQIGRALSLVPAEVRTLQSLSGPHYMELHHVADPGYTQPGRVLDRTQMELIAARVSAINECFY